MVNPYIEVACPFCEVAADVPCDDLPDGRFHIARVTNWIRRQVRS